MIDDKLEEVTDNTATQQKKLEQCDIPMWLFEKQLM
jgi:sulfur transfer protein SufE